MDAVRIQTGKEFSRHWTRSWGDNSVGRGIPWKHRDPGSSPRTHLKASCVVECFPGLLRGGVGGGVRDQWVDPWSSLLR